MKSKILNFVLVLMLVLVLLVLTGCAAVENTETIENEGESVIEEENEITEETSTLLTEEEALEIGNELYDYGNGPESYDSETHTFYLGKSKKEKIYSESIELDGIYLCYPFGDASDVEDYFTEKRLSELTSDKTPSPYGLEKIEGTWYYLEPGIGSSAYLLGTVLTTVDSITEDEIIFTATSYFIADNEINNFYNDSISYSDYDTTEEYINAVESKYTCTTETNEFVIKLEDGNWKIDQQVVVF